MKKLLFLLPFLIIGFKMSFAIKAQGQTALTPTGVVRTSIPGVTIANSSTATVSLLAAGKKDTIRANTLINPTRPYRFVLECQITTPAVSLPALTITVNIGTQSIVLMSSIVLLGNVTNAPLTIEFTVYPKNVLNTQYAVAHIIQNGQATLVLTTANSTGSADMTLDSTIDMPIDVMAQFTGATLGTASITSKVFYKPAY